MTRLLAIIALSVVLLASCQRKTKELITASSAVPVNVQIHAATGSIGPCEPSISINPINTQHIIAGSILDNIYVSLDGGQTWTRDKMKSEYGVYGDPVVRFGYDGTVYFAHLSNPTGKAYVDPEFLDRIVVQRSTDGGVNWNGGTHPVVRGDKDQDKEWLHIDPSTGKVLMSWTEFDQYGSTDTIHHSRILFSQSEDSGITWSDPIALSQIEGDCVDSDNTTEGAVPTMLPDGTAVVVWSMGGTLYLDRSADGGTTWLDEDIIIGDHIGGWDLEIPGIGRVNGMPTIETDLSNGPHRGTLYVNWSDQRNGKDDTDIWIAQSIDKGTTWSDPVRVNDDSPGKHQFFSWMDLDPITGYIYIVFYDRRNHDNTRTDVYLATSKDGGKTFTNQKISESSFKPNRHVFFGDYNDIAAYDGVVRPIWTRLDTFRLSVMTALIDTNKPSR